LRYPLIGVAAVLVAVAIIAGIAAYRDRVPTTEAVDHSMFSPSPQI